VQKLLKDKYPGYSQGAFYDEGGFVAMDLKIDAASAQDRKDKAVAQALETIRNRIDQFGVSEPVIQREGTQNIVVQLPGIKDPQRAIDLIGKTARLEFKMVREDIPPTSAIIPDDAELMKEKSVDSATGAVTEIPLVLQKKSMITGDLLTDAQVRIDSQFNQPYVAIEFNSLGAKLFDQVTAANVGKRFAIVLDNTIYSAPVIRERISGGSAQISGNFTEKTAADLAIVLRAGALPAPVKIIQNVTVGPSLGQDSINKGLFAGLIGVSLVIVFMGIYYKLSGMVANLGMVLNILYLMGALAALGATLTLPGIAAIVLLVGMSVDSNVIIFERIREELKLGKTPLAALNAGYDKAFMTIMDSHVTTLITAAVLFQFGTGPVKGFAVSLSLGIIINLFTSLVGTKVVFDSVLRRGNIKKMSI
jgi:preprotein translocase subunit SecD